MKRTNRACFIVMTLWLMNHGLALAESPKPSKNSTKAKRVKAVTEQEAVKNVASRSEVIAWKKSVDAAAKKRGVSAHIEVDRKENNEIIVHVYEVVPDGADSSHSATFNWYHVNQQTGKVTKEF